jgi:hypothetical protein
VSGGNYTPNGEYLTFNSGTPAGTYNVSVTASSGGQPVATAATTVECVNGTTTSADRAFENEHIAPGQFVTPRNWGLSLGGYGGSVAFRYSTGNGSGDDIRITGNAFSGWAEPGIIWVMKDENHNGEMDDTWYELKGNAEILGIPVTRRYAKTYYRSGVWEDNLGVTGSFSPQHYDPSWPNQLTLVGTRLDRSNSSVHPDDIKGYVDTLDTMFDIGDAVQADGTPVHLSGIDFIRVQTGEHYVAGAFGEISTEIPGGPPAGGSLWSETRTLAGVRSGSNYAYSFVNNSGYDIIVSFKDVSGTLSVPKNQTVPYTRQESKLYYNFSGGNVNAARSGNTLTFTDAVGGT